MTAVVAAFNQEKALVGAFSVLTNHRMELFQALPGAGLLPAAAPELGLAEGGLGAEAGLEDLAGVGAQVHAGEEGAAVTIRPGTREILRLDIIDMTNIIYNKSCKSQKP